MEFRIATKEDIASLNHLVNSAYRGDSSRKGWTTEAELLDGVRTTETSLREMMEKKDAAIIVVAERNEIKGCVYLEKQANVLYLGMLTVSPDLQGQGIGAALMNAAESRAKELGCDRIKMTVISVREELIAFYNRKGFHTTGEKVPFPSDPKFGIPKQPLEFIVMEKAMEKGEK